MLPKEVEKTLRKLGTDGRQVRATLDREFAKYLEDRQKERKKEGVIAAVTGLAVTALRPVVMRTGKQLAERMLDPNQPAFNEQLKKIRQRRRGADSDDSGSGAPKEAGL
jgi:hypothetical protein